VQLKRFATSRLRAVPALALLALVAVLILTAGCGEGGCLTQAEINKKVNEIALGGEFSQAEVEAKQDEIREVRERACQ
jgi:hypothetical protein